MHGPFSNGAVQHDMIPTYQEIHRPDVKMLLCLDPFNRRVRVDELEGDLRVGLALIGEQSPDWAEKVILKARREHLNDLLALGWTQEAAIPGYFNGVDMYFMAYYRQARRSYTDQAELERTLVHKILGLARSPLKPGREKIQRSTERDAARLALLYSTVFAIYPTPLGDPAYLRKTMENGTVYVHIEKDGEVLSAASAEVNRTFANAELTDCATLPTEQGKGHMALLLARLEAILTRDEVKCLYTICRAQSFGMNKVFYNLGYDFGGCLINNCNIYSGLENMNVWHKMRQ